MKFAAALATLLVALAGALHAEEYPATLEWAEVATLSTPLSGRVASVRVEVGDRVKKGSVLATLDTRTFDAELKRAEAEVRRFEAGFTEAEREYKHAQELHKRTVLSNTELQNAELAFATQQANLRRAHADVALARLNLEFAVVKAPFDGVVIERTVQAGETVANQYQVTPMLRLASTERWLARIWADPSRAARLEKGTGLRAVVQGETLDARVRAVGLASRTDAAGGVRVAVDVEILPGRSTLLAPGLPVRVDVP